MKLFVALRFGVPLSVTRTVTVFVLGPCASVGVQTITPVLVLIVMPVGPLTNANVSVLAGISTSVAVFVTVSVVSSFSV